MRKLASIREINAIHPIKGADRIEIVVVDNWEVIAKKGLHKVGEHVVYFEIDSFLPVHDRYEFLRKSCFKSTNWGGDGFRLKTIRLRKQVSQGLVMPLSDFNEMDGKAYMLGQDLTKLLNVKLYEPPLPACLQGKARGNFPSFIRKTSQGRIQNKFSFLFKYQKRSGEFEVSLKLDGSSCTFYTNNGETGVCSRNINLKKDQEGNTFVDMFHTLDMEHKLWEAREVLGCNVAIQGELIGEGIQKNPDNIVGHEFYVFDIWDIDKQKYLNSEERINFCEYIGLKHIPIKSIIRITPETTFDELMLLSETKGLNSDIAEGVVFKDINDGEVSFKAINNNYLLR